MSSPQDPLVVPYSDLNAYTVDLTDGVRARKTPTGFVVEVIHSDNTWHQLEGDVVEATIQLHSAGDDNDVTTFTIGNSGIKQVDANNVEVFRLWASGKYGSIYIGNSIPSGVPSSQGNVIVGPDHGFASPIHNSAQDNVSIGKSPCKGLTTGSGNVLLGSSAGQSIQDGSENVAIGDTADVLEPSASNITLVGAQNDSAPGVTDNATALGANTVVKQNNTVVVGNGDTTDVYFGFPTVDLTSGSLVVGSDYLITSYGAGDDFTNVGAATNAAGVKFTATGTTPTTWTNFSTLALLTGNATLHAKNIGYLSANAARFDASGDDSTGMVGDLAKPFKTIQAAVTALENTGRFINAADPPAIVLIGATNQPLEDVTTSIRYLVLVGQLTDTTYSAINDLTLTNSAADQFGSVRLYLKNLVVSGDLSAPNVNSIEVLEATLDSALISGNITSGAGITIRAPFNTGAVGGTITPTTGGVNAFGLKAFDGTDNFPVIDAAGQAVVLRDSYIDVITAAGSIELHDSVIETNNSGVTPSVSNTFLNPANFDFSTFPQATSEPAIAVGAAWIDTTAGLNIVKVKL